MIKKYLRNYLSWLKAKRKLRKIVRLKKKQLGRKLTAEELIEIYFGMDEE